MDFRSKIASYLPKFKKKTNWKEEVKKEKKQKYLFGGAVESGQGFQRSRNTGKMSKTSKTLSGFATFFQHNLFSRDVFKTYAHVMSIIGLFLILLSIYIIAFSPYFKISPNQVLVEPTTPGIDVGIAYRALESIYGKSIFLLDEDTIKEKLHEHIKNLDTVIIDRLYPNGVKILIGGTPIAFDTTIVGIPDRTWGLSSNGVLIPGNDIKDLQIPYHLELISPELIGEVFLQYKQVISDTNMKVIKKIFDLFSSEWKDLGLTRSRYYITENELHLMLESKTIIILALQDDTGTKTADIPTSVFNQLVTLRTYFADSLQKVTDGSITYIDARIPGKVFACREPAACKKNLILIYGDSYR